MLRAPEGFTVLLTKTFLMFQLNIPRFNCFGDVCNMLLPDMDRLDFIVICAPLNAAGLSPICVDQWHQLAADRDCDQPVAAQLSCTLVPGHSPWLGPGHGTVSRADVCATGSVNTLKAALKTFLCR